MSSTLAVQLVLAAQMQLERETQHPLAHGLLGWNFVNQQGCTLHHAPCPATGTEASSFAAECDQVFSVTRLAAHP
jgi:hypothetical protein